MDAEADTTGARLLVEALLANDVDRVFCVPGESYLSVLDALHDLRDRMETVARRQEGGAAMMAEADAKLTGPSGNLHGYARSPRDECQRRRACRVPGFHSLILLLARSGAASAVAVPDRPGPRCARPAGGLARRRCCENHAAPGRASPTPRRGSNGRARRNAENSIPARLKRAGMETRLLIGGAGGEPRRDADRSMLRLLARAQRFSTMVMRGDGKTVAELAKEVGVTASYFTRILRLRFLAPEAVKAILSDRHPRKLTGKRLSVHTKLPHAWSEQLALLGIS